MLVFAGVSCPKPLDVECTRLDARLPLQNRYLGEHAVLKSGKNKQEKEKSYRDLHRWGPFVFDLIFMRSRSKYFAAVKSPKFPGRTNIFVFHAGPGCNRCTTFVYNLFQTTSHVLQ